MIKTINPANGAIIKTYDEISTEQAYEIVDNVHEDYIKWRHTDFNHRAEFLKNAAQLLRERRDVLARLISAEMGKVHKEAISEIEKCAHGCEYYAAHAAEFLSDEEIQTDMTRSLVTYQPIGVILAVMPWNFPFWQVFRFAAPTLMAGNGAVLKHAGRVTGCALAIEEIFKEAGFPDHIFRTLLIGSKKVESIIEHKHICAVTLTGSTGAGRAVAEVAGRNLKKSVLELGGSDPYIVLPDADIEHAAQICADSRMINAGQTCISAKRFIIVDEVYDAFINSFKNKMSAKIMGDPADERSDLGPQASVDLRDALHDQVISSIEQGGRCILGGEIPDQGGAWYPPTILIDVTKGMPAYEEELFGPVAAVIKAENTDHAIDIANESDFGLGGAVFTRDIEKGLEIARTKIDSGLVAVNGLVKSDPKLPFGGVKDSGYGRELSHYGMREFVNIKTVTVG